MSSAGSVLALLVAIVDDDARDWVVPDVEVVVGMEEEGESLAMNLRDSNMALLMDW